MGVGMAEPPRGLLILDACVLIDFVEADPGLFQRMVRHLGRVIVPSPLLREVKGVDVSFFRTHGVEVIDPNTQQLMTAAGRRGKLSFEDHLCLLMARDEGCTCVTNDGALRKACASEGVEVVWGLRLVLNLVAAGGLTDTEATSISRAIHASNPMHISQEILDAFDLELGRL